MGPPEEKPEFPIYDSYNRPGFRVILGQKYFYPCNWLQILENTMDAIHTAFLHTIVSGAVFTDEFGVLPELEFAETPVGIIYIATRRVGDNIWARMVENVLPNLQQVAPIRETGHHEHPFSSVPILTRKASGGPVTSRRRCRSDRSPFMVSNISARPTEGSRSSANR